jgi:hypothetical protein
MGTPPIQGKKKQRTSTHGTTAPSKTPRLAGVAEPSSPVTYRNKDIHAAGVVYGSVVGCAQPRLMQVHLQVVWIEQQQQQQEQSSSGGPGASITTCISYHVTGNATDKATGMAVGIAQTAAVARTTPAVHVVAAVRAQEPVLELRSRIDLTLKVFPVQQDARFVAADGCSVPVHLVINGATVRKLSISSSHA